MRTELIEEKASKPAIPEWELAVLDVFVRAAALFGFRKSVALVYGALYCSRDALAAQEIQDRLKISRGSVVEALFHRLWMLFLKVGIKALVGWDTYLRNVFGDYMQLPPPERRVSKHSFKAWKRK